MLTSNFNVIYKVSNSLPPLLIFAANIIVSITYAAFYILIYLNNIHCVLYILNNAV